MTVPSFCIPIFFDFWVIFHHSMTCSLDAGLGTGFWSFLNNFPGFQHFVGSTPKNFIMSLFSVCLDGDSFAVCRIWCSKCVSVGWQRRSQVRHQSIQIHDKLQKPLLQFDPFHPSNQGTSQKDKHKIQGSKKTLNHYPNSPYNQPKKICLKLASFKMSQIFEIPLTSLLQFVDTSSFFKFTLEN